MKPALRSLERDSGLPFATTTLEHITDVRERRLTADSAKAPMKMTSCARGQPAAELTGAKRLDLAEAHPR